MNDEERVDPLPDATDDEPACITLVSGADDSLVYEAFGADPTQAESLAVDLAGDGPLYVLVEPRANGVLAVEPDGFQGSREVVLCNASMQGGSRACWTTKANTSCPWPRAGESFSDWIRPTSIPSPIRPATMSRAS
jgi:hypothetical protein